MQKSSGLRSGLRAGQSTPRIALLLITLPSNCLSKYRMLASVTCTVAPSCCHQSLSRFPPFQICRPGSTWYWRRRWYPWPFQVLVAEDKEAKCPITVHSKKDHKLLVKGGFLHTEVIRPSTLRIIGFERSIPGRYFVIIWQQNWRRSVLTTNTCAHSGCSQGHSAESRPHLRPETPEVPGQSWLKATGRMQGGAAGLEAGAGAGG